MQDAAYVNKAVASLWPCIKTNTIAKYNARNPFEISLLDAIELAILKSRSVTIFFPFLHDFEVYAVA